MSHKFNISMEHIDAIAGQLKTYLKTNRLDGVTLGVSGGVDSATSLGIARKVLEPEQIYAMWMPYQDQEPHDARAVAKKFSVTLHTHPVNGVVSAAIEAAQDHPDKLRVGNFCARSRMMLLYDQAKLRNSIVLGTSNRSEIMSGYFTKWGDQACDFSPLAQFFKTEVYQMAELLKVPQKIINKPPSAGFYEGQEDEDELGITYEELDQNLILKIRIDKIIGEAGDIKKFRHTNWLVRKSDHKRKPLVGIREPDVN